MTLQDLDLSIFTAGIVLGGFGSPLLAVFAYLSREDEDTSVKGVLLTLGLTCWFFVTAFVALGFAANDLAAFVQSYWWIPGLMLAGGCIFVVPLVWLAGYLKVGTKRSSPKSKEGYG